MKTDLNEKWAKVLRDQPESKMGSQDVILSYQDGSEEQALVLNCSILITNSNIHVDDINRMEVIHNEAHNDSSYYLG